MFPHLVTDIGKVKFDPNNKWEEPKFVVVDDEVSAMQACGELRPFPELVVDIEVGIEKDTSFDHPNKYQMLCIGVCYAQGKAVVFGEEACKSQVVIEALRELFVKAKLIGQNLKFDLAGLFPLMGSLEAFFDTMIASYVLDERPGIHGLKQMSVEILGAPQYDDELGRYVRGGESYANVPRPVLYKYNAYDVVCTMALYHIFRQRLEDEPAPTQWYLPEGRNLRWLHDFLVGAANQLMFMELNGLKVDIPLLNEMTETYLKRIDDIEEELSLQYSDPAKGPINPRSPIQVKKALAELGVQVESTAKDVLQEICDVKARRGEMDTALFRFCEILLRHRREAKLYGTYIKGTRKRLYMGRVHPTFLVHGTTTGRLSCRNPNLQNVPRESVIRKLFIPTKPGRVFVQPDYSQAELRIACYLAQDEYFREIFNDPTRDLFNELTPVLYPNVGDVDAAAKKELRIRVKAYVYGLAYGREAFSIAQEFKISEREARDGMRRFFDVIPGIVAWRQDVQRRVLQGEDLVTPFGRRRRFWLITNDNKDDVLKEALAFLPQSTSSDICLGAAAELRVRLRGMAFLRNIVHDSILAECDAADADEVTAVMSEVMLKHGKAVVGDYVRFQVDCKVGASWGEV
jgi:DNA polymerase-1